MDIRHILIQLEMVNSLISEIEDEMEIALGKIPYSSKMLSVNYPAHRAGHLKKLEEGDCIPHTPAPHSSPSTGRGILREELIKGFGVVSVAGLIGEIGDFRQFNTQPEIMKLAGLDLYEISSGKMKG